MGRLHGAFFTIVSTHLQRAAICSRRIVIALFAVLMFGPPGQADTGDVIDDFLPAATGVRWCVTSAGNQAGVVWADIDADGTYDTQVVFTTISGQAYVDYSGTGDKRYYFTPFVSLAACPDSTPTTSERGRYVIHFVDILAPGFVWNDPATWTYKRIPALSLRASHDLSLRTGVDLADAYQLVQAYRNLSQTDLITGSATPLGGSWTEYGFSDDTGIMELYISTDFGENELDEFILHEATTPTEPGVVMLFDTSGSMSWDHNGTYGVPVDQQRLSLAKRAAIPFMDLLNIHGAGTTRFGIATFPPHPWSGAVGCNGQMITDMTETNGTSHDAAINVTIPGLVAEGNTPLLAGVNTARDMLSSETRKAIVLLSDGYHNCPTTVEAGDADYTALVNGLTDAGVRVYTIGFARPGDVDNHFLDELSSATTGEFADVTQDAGFDPGAWDPATALSSFYSKILADGLGLAVSADPLAVIDAGITKQHMVAVNPLDRKVSFFVSWATPTAGRLGVTVKSADGVVVEGGSMPGVQVYQGDTYKIISVDKSFLQLPGKVGMNNWTIDIDGGQLSPGTREHYQYSVINDSALKMSATLDKNSYRTGDAITLTARLAEPGKPLLSLGNVTVTITRPNDGAGNWFAENSINAKKLATIPTMQDNETLHDLQRKATFLTDVRKVAFPQRSGPLTLGLYDDGSHGDSMAGDGIYTNRYSDTVREGTYSFYFQANGNSSDGKPFEREALIQKYITVNVDPDKVVVTVIPRMDPVGNMHQYRVVVTPKDRYGNYLGPRYGSQITMTTTKGSFSGGIKDGLDGSYRQLLNVPMAVNAADVDVGLNVRGESLNFNLADRLSMRRASAHIGLAIPRGSFNNSYNTGLSLEVDIEQRLAPQLLAVGVLGFNQFDGATAGVSDTYWWNLSANLKYEFTTDPLRAYVNGGAGLYVPESGSSKGGYNIGVGVDYDIPSGWTFELGAEYHNIFTSGSKTQFVVPHIGGIYRF
jgi:opacity protein-like surface antigen